MTTFVHLVIQVAETNNSIDQKDFQIDDNRPIGTGFLSNFILRRL